MHEDATRIAELNDVFRQSGYGFMVTNGVRTLEGVHKLIELIRQYDTFTEENDPYGEHDSGSLVWHNEKIFWKIDYYDRELKYGSDPWSPTCQRILTVMLASEY
ncbi:MAG TPA: DUF3768 domain-containing protein [Candidatus Saccharimonadales bacterium]|nr:DUF3768 domain-containing protein [Candidatus Saccharimonadales bacterium]